MSHIALLTLDDQVALKVQRALACVNAQIKRTTTLQGLGGMAQLSDLAILHLTDLPKLLMCDEVLNPWHQTARATIAIVARTQWEWAVQLLNAGIDRCVTDPFDEAHLGAVARALLRRQNGRVSSLTQYRGLRFDHERHLLQVHGVAVTLTKREAQVLDVLLRKVGKIISKEDFVHSLQPENEAINSDAIEVYIHRLRKKISHDVLPIRNIKRCGYFLKPDIPLNFEFVHDHSRSS